MNLYKVEFVLQNEDEYDAGDGLYIYENRVFEVSFDEKSEEVIHGLIVKSDNCVEYIGAEVYVNLDKLDAIIPTIEGYDSNKEYACKFILLDCNTPIYIGSDKLLWRFERDDQDVYRLPIEEWIIKRIIE